MASSFGHGFDSRQLHNYAYFCVINTKSRRVLYQKKKIIQPYTIHVSIAVAPAYF